MQKGRKGFLARLEWLAEAGSFGQMTKKNLGGKRENNCRGGCLAASRLEWLAKGDSFWTNDQETRKSCKIKKMKTSSILKS